MKSVTQSQVCTKCGIEKPMDDFANERRVKSGKTRQCKQCHYAEVDKFSKIRRERLRNRPPAELSPDVMRTCRVCFEDKPETEFYRNRTMIDGIHSSCKLCNNSKHKSWKVANKDKVKQQRRRLYELHEKDNAKSVDRNRTYHRNWRYETKYGITYEQFLALVKKQNNCCALCGEEFIYGMNRKPQVDHDHETGLIRGVLCKRCNQGLGNLGDDIAGIERAARYLRKPQITPSEIVCDPKKVEHSSSHLSVRR